MSYKILSPSGWARGERVYFHIYIHWLEYTCSKDKAGHYLPCNMSWLGFCCSLYIGLRKPISVPIYISLQNLNSRPCSNYITAIAGVNLTSQLRTYSVVCAPSENWEWNPIFSIEKSNSFLLKRSSRKSATQATLAT